MIKNMNRHVLVAVVSVAAVGLLGACGEKPQTANPGKSDQAPYAGTGVAPFTTAGWKAGDKTSWEQAIKARGQYGQNEYSRAAAIPGTTAAAAPAPATAAK
jgi:hypothetical protein